MYWSMDVRMWQRALVRSGTNVKQGHLGQCSDSSEKCSVGVEVRAVYKPLEIFRSNLGKPCFHKPCFVHRGHAGTCLGFLVPLRGNCHCIQRHILQLCTSCHYVVKFSERVSFIFQHYIGL